MKVRKIRPEELLECDKIEQVAFEGTRAFPETAEEYEQSIARNPQSKEQAFYKEKWACYTDADEMMACVSALPYQVYFDGTVLNMTGIAGVCTYPQHRRKGAVRSCMNAVLEDAWQKGVSFSYLHAFSETFYAGFGYAPSCHSSRYTFSMDALESIACTGTFSLYKDEKDLSGYQEAYAIRSKGLNLMVKRGEHDWYFLKSANPFQSKRFAYLYRDETGAPCGYLLFHKTTWQDHPLMEVEEMVFDDKATAQALFSFIKSFSANYHFVRFKAPRHLPLSLFCKDSARYSTKHEIVLNGMVRVVSVENVLSAARYQGTGMVRISIKDTTLRQNNGVFALRFAHGRCTALTKSDEEPDIVMDINTFSAAITGNVAFDDFAWMDSRNVAVLANEEQLRKVFFRKPCWLSDSF